MGSRLTILTLAVVTLALAGLNVYQMQTAALSPVEVVSDRFLIHWSGNQETWRQQRWLGIPTYQMPMDMWVTQEILSEVKPTAIVEAGTFRGGSAALWAMILEHLVDDPIVVTIDISNGSKEARKLPISQRRVKYLIGSSTSPLIVEQVKELVAGRKVLVILDSLHTRDHVLAELRAYADLVPVGSYIIVQDGAICGHPVNPELCPGPYEAVEEFLAENDDYVIDHARERMMITANPNGFLRRVK